jgi:hypothetical protein
MLKLTVAFLITSCYLVTSCSAYANCSATYDCIHDFHDENLSCNDGKCACKPGFTAEERFEDGYEIMCFRPNYLLISVMGAIAFAVFVLFAYTVNNMRKNKMACFA